jgi:hypothetical protein
MTSLSCFHTFPFSPRLSRFHLRPTVLGAVLVCVSPAAVSAQSVSFAGPGSSVNFGNVNLCPTGHTTPAPCSEALALTYHVTVGGTLGTIKVVTQGTPNLDFTLASGSTCSGSVTAGNTCKVNVKFAPLYVGSRPGAVQITDESGKVLATTLIYGSGVGPQIEFPLVQINVLNKFDGPPELAVDSIGDLFIAEGSLIEIPAGGGPAVTLGSGIQNASGVALDGAGNVYFSDNSSNGQTVVEIPAGDGAQITLPFEGLSFPYQIAVGVTGDVFVADSLNGRVVELPSDGSAQVTLPFTYLNFPVAVAVDGGGDVFAAGETELLKLPGDGGPQVTLFGEDAGWNSLSGLAADGLNDVFVVGGESFPGIVEFPAGGGVTSVGQNLSDITSPTKVAVDAGGDFFVVDEHGVDKLQGSESAALSFGTIAIGSPTTMPLTFTNAGTETLTVVPSFNTSSYTVQSIEPTDCLAGTAPGQSCTLQIQFSPPTTGELDGILTLQTNGALHPTVTLQGAASGVGTPVFSPPSGVYAGAQSVSITAPNTNIYYTTNGTAPTSSSAPYTGPISVTSTETLEAIAIVASTPSAIATATYTIASSTSTNVINLSHGFSQAQGPMQFNGNTDMDGSRLQLTKYRESASSAFYATPVNIQSFTTNFTFQLTIGSDQFPLPLSDIADGITFTIQNAGAEAIGAYGEALGYAPIGKSVAVKFDLHNNVGEGPNSTGLYVDGALPTVPAIDLTGSGIDLHSGDSIFAQIAYNGTNLVLTLTDTATFATWSHSFTINIPETVGGSTAYIGFTGGTGEYDATQEILSWTYIAGAPGLPAPPPSAPPVPDYPVGFNEVGLANNGSAVLSGSVLQLSSGGQFGSPNAAGSSFYAIPANIQSFTTDFSFQIYLAFQLPAAPALRDLLADGFTFNVQNVGPTALGGIGGALGYAGIGKSVAIKFDVHNNSGEGPNSTGLYVNGAPPTVPAIDLTGTGIDLRSGDTFKAHIAYDGMTLNLTLTDTATLSTWSHSFTIDIPTTIGGNLAYVGFTGATGLLDATQNILNWTFTTP